MTKKQIVAVQKALQQCGAFTVDGVDLRADGVAGDATLSAIDMLGDRLERLPKGPRTRLINSLVAANSIDLRASLLEFVRTNYFEEAAGGGNEPEAPELPASGGGPRVGPDMDENGHPVIHLE